MNFQGLNSIFKSEGLKSESSSVISSVTEIFFENKSTVLIWRFDVFDQNHAKLLILKNRVFVL